MRARFARRLAGLLLLPSAVLAVSCRTTVDSLGFDRGEVGAGGDTGDGGARGLGTLTGPASYPNYFREVLGKDDAAIKQKLDAAFNRLFHGDPNDEAVYFTEGGDLAYVRDILHGDIRSEGVSWGMLIAVQLGKQDEFDRLWAYAKTTLAYPSSDANAGYFRSFCDEANGGRVACADPFGFQQFLSALLFARGRFASSTRHDYEADALGLFDVIQTNATKAPLFDATSNLVLHLPNAESAGVTRPSLEMPAYYELWAQATGDSRYRQTASAARSYFALVANTTTGLLPIRSRFDGRAVADFDYFGPEAYRAQISLALDAIFFNKDPWQAAHAQRMLDFFVSKGLDTYGQAYSLDGQTCLELCQRESALIAANGITAALAPPSAARTAFIQAVWDLDPPTGPPRYYPGMVHLIALLILGGQYRVY